MARPSPPPGTAAPRRATPLRLHRCPGSPPCNLQALRWSPPARSPPRHCPALARQASTRRALQWRRLQRSRQASKALQQSLRLRSMPHRSQATRPLQRRKRQMMTRLQVRLAQAMLRCAALFIPAHLHVLPCCRSPADGQARACCCDGGRCSRRHRCTHPAHAARCAAVAAAPHVQ